MLAGMNLTSWFRVPKWQCPASPAEQFRGYQWAGIWLCLYLYIQLGSEEPLLGEPTYRVFPASAPCCPIFWHTALLPFPYPICSAIGAPTPTSSSFSGLQALQAGCHDSLKQARQAEHFYSHGCLQENIQLGS